MTGSDLVPPCDDPELRLRLRESLLATYFQTYDPDYLASPGGQADIDTHVFGRYDTCIQFVLPWVASCLDLTGARVVEVGCGTGSSTAGFAWLAERVDAYDIDGPSIEGARGRMEILGLENVDLHVAPAEDVLDLIAETHGAGTVDVVLLYAVLEHQTLEERLRCIRTSWELLRDGGLLVVVETPNRLALWDYHTSLLPFFHMLPDELALLYYEESPRDPFKDSVRRALSESWDQGRLTLTRWGRGVGSQEFELVLGDLEPLMVADGYEPPMEQWFPVQFEDLLLQAFFQDKEIQVPVAFTRHVLNFILKKGGRGDAAPPLVPASHARIAWPGTDRDSDAYESLEAELDALRVSHAALEASTAVRLTRRLDRSPRARQVASWTWRNAMRVRGLGRRNAP